MSNSTLINYTILSPNHSGQRTKKITRITPHCVVGQCSVETLGSIFAPTSKQASCNYGIGADGRVGMYVEEKNRSWCSSSNANDQRAVTIECASDTSEPYAFALKLGNDELAASINAVLEKLLADEIAVGSIKLQYIEGLTIENRMACGKPIPDDVMAQIKECDVLLKGPTTTPHGGTMESANVYMRRALDLYANCRPGSIPEKNIDWIFYRENTEGEYALGSRGVEVNDDISIDFKVTTTLGTTRLAKAAFEYAKANGNKNVSIVTKANIMKKTDKNMNSSMGMYMCFGVAIGTSLGVVFDNIAYGVALGISLGVAVGAIIGSKKDQAVNEQVEENHL